MMDKFSIFYDGRSYEARPFLDKEFSKSLIVAEDGLEDAIYDDVDGYRDDKARWIDQGIFAYVPKEVLSLSDDEFSEYVTDNFLN